MTKKILLVDDSALYLILHRRILAWRGGYDVVIATDGEEAVNKAKLHCPDLILMDVEMPRKNGIEACQELRNCNLTAHIPIVLASSNKAEAQKHDALNAGCTCYVHKPIASSALIRLVRNYLEAGSLPESLRVDDAGGFPRSSGTLRPHDMKRAFVLRVEPEAYLAHGNIQGQIEDVETGMEASFCSDEDLVGFLQDTLNATALEAEQDPASHSPGLPKSCPPNTQTEGR
jgi:CheY-like chemotaxis protein